MRARLIATTSLALAGAGIAAVTLVWGLGSSSAGTSSAAISGCMVGSVPSSGGLNAPSDVPPDSQASDAWWMAKSASRFGSPGFSFRPYGVDLRWQDTNTTESCYVIEQLIQAATGDESWEVVGAVPADMESFRRLGTVVVNGNGTADLHYRVYAATATARSDEFEVTITPRPFEEAPTPTPGSPTPTVAPLLRDDADCSGGIEATDALVILRFVAGLDLHLPDGCEPPGE